MESLRTSIGLRLHAAHEILTLVSEQPMGSDGVSKTLKGLLFVVLYGIHEFTISESCRRLNQEFNSRRLSPKNIHPDLRSLVSNPIFESIVDSGRNKKAWEARLRLIEHFESNEPSTIHENIVPNDGSQFRPSQIDLMWRVFNLSGPSFGEERLRGHVTELVENRNRIAHGLSSPDEVGSRYTRNDILKRVTDTESVCVHILNAVSTYFQQPNAFRL